MENQFVKISTPLDDVFILERFCHSDERGIFTKTFNLKMFKELEVGEALEIKESLCSTSKKGVLRGMLSTAPYGAAKISVVKGRILDVIVGIGGKFNAKTRKNIFSRTF